MQCKEKADVAIAIKDVGFYFDASGWPTSHQNT